MTPFGERVRALRRERGVTQREMARALRVSSAYLSALEHGRRGVPTWDLLQRIIGFLGVIWDDAEDLERLAALSDPKVTIDTAGLHPDATRFANRLAETVDRLSSDDLTALLSRLEAAADRTGRGARPRRAAPPPVDDE